MTVCGDSVAEDGQGAGEGEGQPRGHKSAAREHNKGTLLNSVSVGTIHSSYQVKEHAPGPSMRQESLALCVS